VGGPEVAKKGSSAVPMNLRPKVGSSILPKKKPNNGAKRKGTTWKKLVEACPLGREKSTVTVSVRSLVRARGGGTVQERVRKAIPLGKTVGHHTRSRSKKKKKTRPTEKNVHFPLQKRGGGGGYSCTSDEKREEKVLCAKGGRKVICASAYERKKYIGKKKEQISLLFSERKGKGERESGRFEKNLYKKRITYSDDKLNFPQQERGGKQLRRPSPRVGIGYTAERKKGETSQTGKKRANT